MTFQNSKFKIFLSEDSDYKVAFRLLILCVILPFLLPAPHLITPGLKQTVYTEHPILGVHTRLTDEVAVPTVAAQIALRALAGHGAITRVAGLFSVLGESLGLRRCRSGHQEEEG